MYDAFHSTFLTLIPKNDTPSYFDDFRPISPCNSIYKIIAKVIENHIKPILSKLILKEHFAFLEGRKIHEAIGVSQEGLHSLKEKRFKGMVYKIDLSKGYDKSDYIYIRILLTHLGFNIYFINWVVCCIYFVSFVVLIKGFAS